MFEYSEADLVQAVEMNRPEPLQQFISQNPRAYDILDRIRDENGQSLLLLAAFEGARDVLPVLLQCPKILRKLNSTDSTQRTALHLAAAIGDEVCVRSLIDAGAAIDPLDEFRCTPLHLAIKFEQLETVRVLLELGADASKKDLKGDNAVDMAKSTQDAKIIATRESTCHVEDGGIYALLTESVDSRAPSSWKRLLPTWGGRRRQAYEVGGEAGEDEQYIEPPPKPPHNTDRLPQGSRRGGA